LVFAGCQEPTVTGKVTASLEKSVLRDGETTKISVGGENTGDLPTNVVLRLSPEDSAKLVLIYPGSLESTLQPGESITKVISVQGFTDHTSTTYSLLVELVNRDTNEVLDSQVKTVTVKKEA